MLALLLLAALVTAGPPWRRAIGLAIALGLILWPPALDASTPLLRGFLALFTFWGAARVLDLAREPRALSPLHRVVHVVAILDTRAVTGTRVAFRPRLLLACAVWTAVGLLALSHAADAPHVLRWALGALFVYSAAEAVHHLALTLLAALGLRSTVPLHRAPIRARSLREFWGDRWNLIVGRWLRAHFFRPLARRRRPKLGLGLAFLASAGLHAWFAGVALGPLWAASMGAFFLVQAALVALEKPLAVDRWPAPAAWSWTMASLLLPSPLFTEPLLRIFEPVVTAVV